MCLIIILIILVLILLIALLLLIIELIIRGLLADTHQVPKKTCFLVSNRNWQHVLGCIPIAMRARPVLGSWGLSKLLWIILKILGAWISIYTLIRKTPVLVFHEEDDGSIDVDSIIYFLQQFNPQRVYLIGDRPEELDLLLTSDPPVGAGLAEDILYETDETGFAGFWHGFKRIVVVDRNNYRCGQMGAVFASLHSIPVFFVDDTNLNAHQSYINSKIVYTIGDLDEGVTAYIDSHARTHLHYDLNGLIDHYIHRTMTRMIILTNPDDLNISINQVYQPDKSANEISTLFTKDSLGAPILAAGRLEVILYTEEGHHDYSDYNQLIESYVQNGKIDPAFLTIIGSPSAIPQSMPLDPPNYWGHHLEFDGRYYGSVVQDMEYVDIATGRIYSISTSDVTANIARSLFYNYLPRNKIALVIPREDRQSGISNPFDEADLENYYRQHYWTDQVESQFDTTNFYSGHTEVQNNRTTIEDYYDEANLVLFANHGYSAGFSGVMSSTYFISNQTYLTCTSVIDLACSTGQYDKVPDSSKPQLFNVQSIRRGVIVQIAAVSVSYWHRMFGELLDYMYLRKKSMGEAYRIAKNADYDRDVYNFCPGYRGDPTYFLMGDPAFVPKYW